MELALGAKSTKPGSKATAKRGSLSANGKPARVPVGTLHYIDLDAQSQNSAMYDALCGETALMRIDGALDESYDNERCSVCADTQWAAEFDTMQRDLLH